MCPLPLQDSMGRGVEERFHLPHGEKHPMSLEPGCWVLATLKTLEGFREWLT